MHAPADLTLMPGHQLRRLQQISVASFLMETQDVGLTPLQFAAMTALAREPLLDQRALAWRIGLDASTLGGVVDRLADRGLIERRRTPQDRRVYLLTLTNAGQALQRQVQPGVARSQARLLAPLPAPAQAQFLQMLRVLVGDLPPAAASPQTGAAG